jgi:hypothetical protein
MALNCDAQRVGTPSSASVAHEGEGTQRGHSEYHLATGCHAPMRIQIDTVKWDGRLVRAAALLTRDLPV